MRSKKEHEIINHTTMSYIEIFLIEMISRNPHGHDDLEIGVVLEGSLELILDQDRVNLNKGDIYIINRYQIHSFRNNCNKNLILAFQIGTNLYKKISYNLTRAKFKTPVIKEGAFHDILYSQLLCCAKNYFNVIPNYELICGSILLDVLYKLITNLPSSSSSEKEHYAGRYNTLRLNRIIDFISSHYTEQILLKDIADMENITSFHASHLIKNILGISFQDYLNNIRFEHALRLINDSDLTLLDICMETGFSSTRYLNNMFQKKLNCTANEYRKNKEIASVIPLEVSTGNKERRLSIDEARSLMENIKFNLI